MLRKFAGARPMASAIACCAVVAMLAIAAPAGAAPLGISTPSKVDTYIGNYPGSNGSIVIVTCYETQGYTSPNATNGDYSRIRFTGYLSCSDVVRVRGTAELYTFGDSATLMATGSSFDQTWSGTSVGEGTRSTAGTQQIKFHTALDMPWGGVWTNIPFGCSGIHTGHVECHEFRYSTPFAFDPDVPTGLAGSLVSQGIGTVFSTVGQVQQEVACAQGQISNPNPGNGSTACRAVGTGVVAANGALQTVNALVSQAQQEAVCSVGQVSNPDATRGGTACRAVGTGVVAANGAVQTVNTAVAQTLGTVNTLVGQAQQEAACAQGQVTNPDPANGSQTCRAVGTVVKTANDAGGNALGTLNAAVTQVQQDAACAQTQVGSPDPTRGGDVCRAVGSGVVTANNARNTALGLVSDVQTIANGAVATAQQAIGQAQQDAACAQTQVSNPDPTRGSEACKTVGAGVVAARDALPDNDPGNWSDTCGASATVADGFAGSTYVKLRVQSVDAQTTWVCFRASLPDAADVGGRVDITGASASPSLPSTDDNSAACQGRSGNVGVVNGTLAGTPLHVNANPGTSDSWVCVEVGTVKKRVIVPVSGATTPSLATHLDQPAPPVPAAQPGPVGYPSSSCQALGGTAATRIANMDGPNGAHAWAYTWQESPSKLAVCVRVQGPAAAGGKLEIDTSASPGMSPVVQTSTTDMAPCTEEVFDFTDPVATFMRTSKVQPTVTNPASVCIGLAGQRLRATVGTSGTAQVPPVVTWSPDPGMP